MLVNLWINNQQIKVQNMKTFKEKGYTAVELMIVIVIVAILVTAAVPNFSGIANKNKITAATNELSGLLQYAKTIAVSRNTPVIVCPYTGSGSSFSCGSDFSSKNIGVFLYDDMTELLRTVSLSDSVTLTNQSSSGFGNSVAFYPDSSSAIHGLPSTFKKFNADGSVSSTTITLDANNFPTGANRVVWRIGSGTETICKFINVSAIGQSRVTEGNCL